MPEHYNFNRSMFFLFYSNYHIYLFKLFGFFNQKLTQRYDIERRQWMNTRRSNKSKFLTTFNEITRNINLRNTFP